MENFVAYIPTKVHFGRDVIEDLPEAVQEQGNRVLFLYGKGSVVKAGIYDKVKKKLDSARVEVYEYSGIKSNPVVDDVDKAAELGRSKKVDVIVALGGGSVIDSSKV
ncbi:MAG: iron-containing alcohol dehydrogenase, partial [Bacteroidota bacterium]